MILGRHMAPLKEPDLVGNRNQPPGLTILCGSPAERQNPCHGGMTNGTDYINPSIE